MKEHTKFKKPYCLTCNCPMEKIEIGKNIAMFTRTLGNQRPYEVMHTDIHQCPRCKTKVACQYADQPHWRHHHEEPVPFVDYAVWEK